MVKTRYNCGIVERIRNRLDAAGRNNRRSRTNVLSRCVRDGSGVLGAARNMRFNHDRLGYGKLVLSDGDGDSRRMGVYCFGDFVGGINDSSLANSSVVGDYILSRTNGYCLGCPDSSGISLYQSRQGQCRGSERRAHHEVAWTCVRMLGVEGLYVQSLYSWDLIHSLPLHSVL